MWTYENIVNPSFRYNLAEHADELNGLVDLELADGKIRVSARQALFNLFVWPIISGLGGRISKRHWIMRTHLTRDSLSVLLNRYFNEYCSDLANVERDTANFKQVLWNVYYELYALCGNNLQRYAASIDLLDIAEIMQAPKMQDIIKTKENIKPIMGTAVIEKLVDVESKKISELLKIKPSAEGALDHNALYPYHVLEQINKFQLPQMVYAFGIRTDINDSIIGLPVIGSAVDGLRSAVEYAVESLSAKKSTYYNNGAVSSSQYFNRRQHLIASACSTIHKGDCGSTKTVPFEVTKDNYVNLVGKYIVEADGSLVCLTDSNLPNYIGTTINMRSAQTCRHRDGVCEICGGRIMQTCDKNIHIGILAAMQVVSPATQQILSAKHLIKTSSLVYNIPEAAANIFTRVGGDTIYWSDEAKAHLPGSRMGVPVECFGRFDNIPLIREGDSVAIDSLSCVSKIFLDVGGEVTDYDLTDGDQIPYFSEEMLYYIKRNYNKCEQVDDIIWIPIAGTKRISIFKTVVENDSTLAYVNSLMKFFQTTIKQNTTCHNALKTLANLMYSKVRTNITYLDVLLKCYLITDGRDARIPEVQDANNVIYENEAYIINNRSVGVKLAFQDIMGWISDPKTYVLPKQRSVFDILTVGSAKKHY